MAALEEIATRSAALQMARRFGGAQRLQFTVLQALQLGV
jgi:hypothetical protein